MINCIWITIIAVLVIDQTDAIDSLKGFISRLLTKGKVDNRDYSLKPLDCSLCTSWWLNLLYIIITSQLTILNVAIILSLAVLTPVINDVITLVIKALQRLITVINNILS